MKHSHNAEKVVVEAVVGWHESRWRRHESSFTKPHALDESPVAKSFALDESPFAKSYAFDESPLAKQEPGD